MNQPLVFKAPWGTSLKVLTGLSSAILVVIITIGIFFGPHSNLIWIAGMIVIPLSMFFIASLFTIRGYQLTLDALLIQRLFWNSRVELSELQSAEVDAEAMKQSARIFGNGGLFCFAGKFDSNRLGTYRAFATDPKNSVVLRFNDKKIVVTPESADVFVTEIMKLAKMRNRV